MADDNTTAHPASEYEVEVQKTIPFHDEIMRTAIDVALTARPSPARWLDTGAGPGKLALLAHARTPDTEIFVADPSEAMLALARARLSEWPQDRFVAKGSAELPDIGPFDVITAMLCHHYGDMAARESAVARCRALLAPGGAFVVVENVRAETDAGHAMQRARWAAWLKRAGRDDAAIAKHFAREGSAFFPIRVSEHMALLSRSFDMVEMVWRAYGQAGFVATLAR